MTIQTRCPNIGGKEIWIMISPLPALKARYCYDKCLNGNGKYVEKLFS